MASAFLGKYTVVDLIQWKKSDFRNFYESYQTEARLILYRSMTVLSVYKAFRYIVGTQGIQIYCQYTVIAQGIQIFRYTVSTQGIQIYCQINCQYARHLDILSHSLLCLNLPFSHLVAFIPQGSGCSGFGRCTFC